MDDASVPGDRWPIQFGGFLAPERVTGDYVAVASFLVHGQRLLVTVSVTLAALVEGRAGHRIDWLDYPPLAALGYDRIADLLDQGLSASEIPLTADDADALLALDRHWWREMHGVPPPAAPPT
jgi:hypothetical protein